MTEAISPGGTRCLHSSGGTRHAVSPGGTRYVVSAGGRRYVELSGGTRSLFVVSPGGTRYLVSAGGTRKTVFKTQSAGRALHRQTVSSEPSDKAQRLEREASAPRASPVSELHANSGQDLPSSAGIPPVTERTSKPKGAKHDRKATSDVRSKLFDSTFKTALEKDLEPSKHIETIARIHSHLPITMLYEETYREELCEPGEVFYNLPQIERCALGMQMPFLSKMVLAIHLLKLSNFPYGICSYEISSRLVTFKILHGTATHTLFRALFDDLVIEDLAQIGGCIQVIKKSKPGMSVIMLRANWDKVANKVKQIDGEQILDLFHENWGDMNIDSNVSTGHDPISYSHLQPPSLARTHVGNEHAESNCHPVHSITDMMFQNLAPPHPPTPQVVKLLMLRYVAILTLFDGGWALSFGVLDVLQATNIDTSPHRTTWDDLWEESTHFLHRFLEQESLKPAAAERVATAFSRRVSNTQTR